jgi:hypothetical protein
MFDYKLMIFLETITAISGIFFFSYCLYRVLKYIFNTICTDTFKQHESS